MKLARKPRSRPLQMKLSVEMPWKDLQRSVKRQMQKGGPKSRSRLNAEKLQKRLHVSNKKLP